MNYRSILITHRLSHVRKYLRLVLKIYSGLRRHSPGQWLLGVEVLFMLSLSRLMILLLPFRRIFVLIGEVGCETPYDMNVNTAHARRMGTGLQVVSQYLPWRSMCLEQALAGMMMLKRRQLPGTVYFGIEKEGQEMRAHAWLRCGSQIVTGAAGRERFTALFHAASVHATSDSIRNEMSRMQAS